MNEKELRAFLNTTEVPFCDLAVWRDHEQIFRYGRGFTDEAGKKPLDGSEIYNLYSASKVMTAAAGAKAIELGLISLEDPVCKYLPEYEHMTYLSEGSVLNCRNTMTLRHLFTMSAGLDYDITGSQSIMQLLRDSGGRANTREIAEAISKKPLCFEPGEGFKYSLCLDVLGAVLEVASGMTLGAFMSKYLWSPLGMTSTTFLPEGELADRVAAQYQYSEAEGITLTDKRGKLRLTDAFEGGGAGILSSVDDYIRFADALACGGVGANGVRILDESTVALMRTPMLGEKPLDDFRSWSEKYACYSYGLGVRVRVVPEEPIPLGEFGWNSVGGAYCLIDTKNRLSVFYAQHVFRHSGRANLIIHPIVRDAAYRLAGIK